MLYMRIYANFTSSIEAWEEKRGGVRVAEAYRCWLFGEGLKAGG